MDMTPITGQARTDFLRLTGEAHTKLAQSRSVLLPAADGTARTLTLDESRHSLSRTHAAVADMHEATRLIGERLGGAQVTNAITLASAAATEVARGLQGLSVDTNAALSLVERAQAAVANGRRLVVNPPATNPHDGS